MVGLRQRCEGHLRGIRVPHPFDLDAFCAEVAERRGRPLIRHAVAGLGSGAPCGLWFSTGRADHICFEASTSPLHAEHIVLHELAHMLCGHRSRDGAMTLLFPDLDPALVRRALGRSDYSTSQEREAEMLASLIRGRPGRPRTTLARVADAFGSDG